MNDVPIAVLAVVLLLLLLASAFFSMSETAMLAANRIRLRRLAHEGLRGAADALQLLEQTERLLGVILIGNNFVNVASASLSTVLMFRLFGQNDWVLGLATVMVTLAILIFSEATPKIFASQRAERIASFSAKPLKILVYLFSPINRLLHHLVGMLLRMLGAKDRQEQRLSTEELKWLALESTQFSQNIHRNLLGKLLDLERYTVEDVMVPRRQIEWFKLSDHIEDVSHQLTTAHHARLLVVNQDLDDTLGVLSVRKALSVLLEEQNEEESIQDYLRELIHEPLAVLPDTPLLSVVRLFQTQRQRIALVLDEYGHLLGIITLEDILETMVGQFTSHAPKQPPTESEYFVDVDASLTLRELENLLQKELSSQHAKTLNGLILYHIGDIPDAGSCVVIEDLKMELLQSDTRGIRRVRIYKNVS